MQFRWVQGWHINGFGALFGGQILSWVDEDTNMLAYESSHQGTHYTTGGYDRVSFLRPCYSGERLKFVYDIVHYGNRSVTIRSIITNSKGDKVFTCLTTMVRTVGDGLLSDVAEKVNKNAWPWNLVEQLRTARRKEEPL